MALVSMRQLLDHAAENGYGLPAFNVNNLEQVQAIMQAASDCDSPVILQGSAGARKYAGEAFLRDAQQILESVDTARTRVQLIAGGSTGLLRVGATGLAALRQLPQLARIAARGVGELVGLAQQAPRPSQGLLAGRGEADLLA